MDLNHDNEYDNDHYKRRYDAFDSDTRYPVWRVMITWKGRGYITAQGRVMNSREQG